ncbi:hypothetical protein LTR16_010149, partial [Cryomyces antarcticus]
PVVDLTSATASSNLVVGPRGERAAYPRHSCVGHVPLRSLFAGPLQDGEEKPLTADERIAKRAVLRSTANHKGTETFDQSQGTEHTKDRGRATLDAPENEIEAA